MQIRCEQPCQAALQRQVAAPPVARQQPLVICLGRLQLSNIHTQVDSFVVYGYTGTPAAGDRAGYAGMLRRALWLRRLRRSVRHRACGRQEGLLKAPAANRWRQVRANSTPGSPPGALRKRIPQKSASACHASMNHALYCSRGRFVLLPLRGALRSAAADHRYANTL